MESNLCYEERSPPPELAGLISAVWRLKGSQAGEAGALIQPIVPDGCPEVVLHLADPFVQADAEGTWREQPRSLLVGQLTQSVMVGPSGVTHVVGIRFLPWGAFKFLGVPMAELRDTLIPLDTVLANGVNELAERLSEGAPEHWATMVFAYISRLCGIADCRPTLGALAVQNLAGRDRRDSIRTLARRLSVSQRHLERVMRREVGLPPVTLRRILRVQRALRTMLDPRHGSLSDVAVRAGFYDQPHFVREFRRLVGCTPSGFLRGDYELTEQFVAAEPRP